jgi:hypothetical protein
MNRNGGGPRDRGFWSDDNFLHIEVLDGDSAVQIARTERTIRKFSAGLYQTKKGLTQVKMLPAHAIADKAPGTAGWIRRQSLISSLEGGIYRREFVGKPVH